jgi:lipoprotein NlpD
MKSSKLMMRFALISFLILLLTACESNPPAPVIERAPQATKPKPPETKPVDSKANGATNKDWRPDSHIVKKGDTLFGIGLEYGLDYKEIAAANNIAAPYPIKIGQKIDLSSFKTKPATATEATTGGNIVEAKSTDDGVVITPMKAEPVVIGNKVGDKPATDAKPIVSAVTPILSEPKAVREPYSLEALNRATPKPINTTKPADAKPAEAKPTETKPTDTKPADAKPADDESIAWAWPTQGKVVAGFNEASNKGLDIAGKTGQAINAASAGKVIYSGSDLRGYGKLVIVKHNKTYLSVYAHNSKIVVKEGQTVSAGQKIAEMGNTDSNSVKLHFEIRRLGKSVDPAKYLNQN